MGGFMAKTVKSEAPVFLSQTVLHEAQSCKVYLTVWSWSNLLDQDLNVPPYSTSSSFERKGCALKEDSVVFARHGSQLNARWRIAVTEFAYFVIASALGILDELFKNVGTPAYGTAPLF